MTKGEGLEVYVLIVAEHGADEEVLNDLIKLKGVTEASLVYGEYNIHCKIKVGNMHKLRGVIEKIRKLKVITTDTLIAYERTSKRVRRITNEHHKKLWHARARH